IWPPPAISCADGVLGWATGWLRLLLLFLFHFPWPWTLPRRPVRTSAVSGKKHRRWSVRTRRSHGSRQALLWHHAERAGLESSSASLLSKAQSQVSGWLENRLSRWRSLAGDREQRMSTTAKARREGHARQRLRRFPDAPTSARETNS